MTWMLWCITFWGHKHVQDKSNPTVAVMSFKKEAIYLLTGYQMGFYHVLPCFLAIVIAHYKPWYGQLFTNHHCGMGKKYSSAQMGLRNNPIGEQPRWDVIRYEWTFCSSENGKYMNISQTGNQNRVSSSFIWDRMGLSNFSDSGISRDTMVVGV